MSYAFYVYSAWGITALITSGLTLWIALEGPRLQREIKRLEAQGVRRRSQTRPDAS